MRKGRRRRGSRRKRKGVFLSEKCVGSLNRKLGIFAEIMMNQKNWPGCVSDCRIAIEECVPVVGKESD